jgi:hypothetical protein
MNRYEFLVILSTLVFLFAFACDHQVRPDPKLPTDSEQCGPACDNLKALGCEEGEDVLDGETQMMVTCEMWCLDIQGRGHALNPTCAAKITSCEDLEPECSEK